MGFIYYKTFWDYSPLTICRKVTIILDQKGPITLDYSYSFRITLFPNNQEILLYHILPFYFQSFGMVPSGVYFGVGPD